MSGIAETNVVCASDHGSHAYLCCALYAGLVSLTYLDRPVYGLPHMHQRAPAQARFVGHLSPERDPVAYREAVQELLTWHAARHASIPLVINTCGWIKVEFS